MPSGRRDRVQKSRQQLGDVSAIREISSPCQFIVAPTHGVGIPSREENGNENKDEGERDGLRVLHHCKYDLMRLSDAARDHRTNISTVAVREGSWLGDVDYSPTARAPCPLRA